MTIGTNHLRFDPWNSSSTGHQISETAPGTAWRRTREAKLAHQLRTGDCCTFAGGGVGAPTGKGDESVAVGGLSDRGGEGEWVCDYDMSVNGRGRKRGVGVDGVDGVDSRQRDIRSMWRVNKGCSSSLSSDAGAGAGAPCYGLDGDGRQSKVVQQQQQQQQQNIGTRPTTMGAPGGEVTNALPLPSSSAAEQTVDPPPRTEEQQEPLRPGDGKQAQERRRRDEHKESDILRGATVYINGQTTPVISDHKLKGLLVAHGATLALSLSRRVTHVIIGKPNRGPGRGAGAGGGLAAGKIQKEIQRGGWRGIKIVGVEWVMDSIKAGKRLPETRFAINLLSNQKSVLAYMQ